MYRSIFFYNVIFSAITLLLQLRFTGTRQALRRTLLNSPIDEAFSKSLREIEALVSSLNCFISYETCLIQTTG